MVGFCFTSKKSLPFNFPFFMPLPVSTLSAWILMSRTPVDTSGDVKVSEASHLSNFPLIATDASTSKVIALSTGVILKTGTPSAGWPGLAHKDRLDTRKQRAAMGIMRFSFRAGAAKKERSTLPELLTIAVSCSLRYFNVGATGRIARVSEVSNTGMFQTQAYLP